jgi:TolB protein
MTAFRRVTALAAAALVLCLIASRMGAAQEGSPEVRATIEGRGFEKIPIALPDPGSRGSGPARELIETLRADLDFSGFFDVVEPSLYRAVGPGSGDHAEWKAIGADAVVLSTLNTSGSRLDLVARLYVPPAREALLGQRYGGTVDLVRMVAHRLADDIVRQMTGSQGIAQSRIAFVSGHGEGKEIYLMDYDGARVRRITTTGTLNLSPSWAPDAKRLAYVSWRSGRPAIYVMESDGRMSKVKTVAGELNAAPDWSPDGRRLVYTSDLDRNSELYVVDVASGRNTRLTRTPAIETSPAFSPNGREIAFTSDRSGAPQIYLMDAEGLNVRRLTFDGSYNESPAWSPKGDRLAYASRQGGRFEIALLDLASGVVTRLTRGEGNNENPRWSPDGRHLVFASSRAGSYDIYTMKADGSDVRRHTRGGDCFMPDWR